MYHAYHRQKPRSMDISISIAITLGSPRPRLESISKMTARKIDLQQSDESSCDQLLYHTKIFGRKYTRNSYSQALHSGLTAKGMDFRKWNGATRTSFEWDELRRDSDLWFNNGDCHVYLHGKGQSQRAPSFRVPINALMEVNAEHLIGRCLVQTVEEVSTDQESNVRASSLDLYISAPPGTERGQAFLYHTATRNFFAWVFGRSLVGSHLGGALVGLLNSMNEFRSAGEGNFQALLDYMEEEGYLDMRNSPDHALGVLFFAEHFQLEEFWTEAFVHCVGMYESLPRSPGFEYISQTSRALITRSFAEMDMRLDLCSQKLGTFLSDEFSDAYLGIPSSAKIHVEKFRSFLHTFYIAKLGYYPPSVDCELGVFPKSILNQMASDFQKLYEFLVDTSFTPKDLIPATHHGGICVMQNVQAFDHLYKHSPLDHPLPLVPQVPEYESCKKPKGKLRSRFTLPNTKIMPDKRLLTCAAMLKATNWDRSNLNECSLVRAYRGFERDCVFASPIDKHDTLSQTDGRKVRWLLIYSILQTLISATEIPLQVRDTQNVQYNLCVTIPGSPPWEQTSCPCEVLYRLPTGQPEQAEDCSSEVRSLRKTISLELRPDIDYQAIQRKNQHSRSQSDNTGTPSRSNSFKARAGTIRRALSSLGSMPEMQHPKPSRISYHEILVHGYGNGTNDVKFTDVSATIIPELEEPQPKSPAESQTSTSEKSMSRWSHTSEEDDETHSSTGSSYSASGSDSFSSIDLTQETINEFIHTNRGVSVLGLTRAPSSAYSASVYAEDEEKMALEPAPLQLRMSTPDKLLRVPEHINNLLSLGINRELEEYLNA